MRETKTFHKCIDCGKWLHKSSGNICTRCKYTRDHPLTEQEKEDALYHYYNTECDMCGKEGASPRKDGRNYCGHCWMVWNS